MLLVYNGFNYVRNRRSGLKTYWICAKKGSTKCNARCVTDVVDGVQKVVLDSYQHNHEITIVRKKRREKTPPITRKFRHLEHAASSHASAAQSTATTTNKVVKTDDDVVVIRSMLLNID